MKFCTKCGVKIEDGNNICPNCGTRRPEAGDSAHIQASGRHKHTLWKSISAELFHYFDIYVSGLRNSGI